MRLFIALTLPDPLHAALEDTMARLRADGVSGRFTRPENLHLTLHFLGEQPEAAVDALSDILLQVPRDTFPLTLSALGTFSRTGILWAGLSPSPALNRLQKQLGAALARAGFPVEARAFRPHLTLVREFRLPEGYALPGLPAASASADTLCLMESTRVSGKLIYSPLSMIRLKQEEDQ